MPLIVACCYAAIVLCLFFFAMFEMLTGRDEFGYSAIPALYATYPLSPFLEHKTAYWWLAIGVGGGVNFVLLYALLWIAGKAKPSRKAL